VPNSCLKSLEKADSGRSDEIIIPLRSKSYKLSKIGMENTISKTNGMLRKKEVHRSPGNQLYLQI
jgi:hypothetical protein